MSKTPENNLVAGRANSTRRGKGLSRICVVDDEGVVRRVFAKLIKTWRELELCGEYDSGKEALARIPAAKPDAVLMDIRMPHLSGLECMRELRMGLPNLKFIVVTGAADDANLLAAFRGGANGFLSKPVRAEELREAIHLVLEGGLYVSPHVAGLVFKLLGCEPESPEGKTNLTSREREVARLLERGLLYKEIAGELGITPSTVRNHVHSIYQKLGVANKIEAMNKLAEPSGGGSEDG